MINELAMKRTIYEAPVTALLSRREFYARQSEEYVEGSFGGSLPAFLTAFTARKPLSEAEIDELQALIDAHRR